MTCPPPINPASPAEPALPFGNVLVLGGGAWGTALALVAARAGRRTTLWARDPKTMGEIQVSAPRSQDRSELPLPATITITSDRAHAADAECIIACVPAQATREMLRPFAPLIRPGTPIVSAAKGLERGSHATMSQVIAATIPHARPAVLSGPSFAADVTSGLPTALTIAAADPALADRLALTFASPSFRPYASTDLIGVELGGALKNVIAIAAGIVAGARLGASAQSAVTARGFAEIARLARRLGAAPDTLMGLAGLGDLMLTAGSAQSRNFALGADIGAGRDLGRLTGTGAKLAEGSFTAGVALELGQSLGIELPITQAVAEVLAGTLSVDLAVAQLMARPLRPEAI